MVKSENEIRERIKELEENLRQNEITYPNLSYDLQRRMLMQSYNIESQLYALYYVLGEKYYYKHL